MNIITKYFATQIGLFINEDISNLPDEMVSYIEGCIFYFDPENEAFISKLDTLSKFINDNNIETSIFLTRNFSESSPSFDILTKIFQFVVIDLNDQHEDEQAEYHEVLHILRNNVWSNVNLSTICDDKNATHLPRNTSEESDNDYCDAEKQLNDFEDLLNSIQTFKILSQNLDRDDLLSNAEILAEQFAKILCEDQENVCN
ncbi:uncharacterized protein LOC142236990 isoform X2 [Haematobia irritans]